MSNGLLLGVEKLVMYFFHKPQIKCNRVEEIMIQLCIVSRVLIIKSSPCIWKIIEKVQLNISFFFLIGISLPLKIIILISTENKTIV